MLENKGSGVAAEGLTAGMDVLPKRGVGVYMAFHE